MRKTMVFITLFICSFFLIHNVSATSYTARAYINSSCNVRTGPGTQNKRITSLYTGSYYNLVVDQTFADTNNHYDCNSDWYQVYYNGIDVGYVCGDHVDVIHSYNTDDVAPQTTCEVEMSNLGFPSSYWGGLCALKERHPNWQFVALQTGIDWSYAVERESSCGKSYIQTSNEEFMDSSCNNQYAWDSSWKNAHLTAVSYYMDPRNFLSESYIFQFEYLKYSSSLDNYYSSSVLGIIQNSNFYTYHLGLNNNLVDIITAVGKEVDVSPTFLAARIYQELGSGTSLYNLYSGRYEGYEDYYNFYNYGVNDSCATTNGTTYCGLSYAKNNGWKGVTTAIKGGASSISSSYINVGQYTTYLQKFNLIPTNMNQQFTHQFQTNIVAPSSESITSYKSYNEVGLLNQAFVFYIPVFTNMNATISNSNSGGTGEEPSTDPSTMDISTIVTSSGYKYQSGYMTGVEVGSDVSTVKGSLESVAGLNNIIVFDSSGNIINSGIVKTGMKIQINNAYGSETLQIAIKGDTSGDGVINVLDLLQVQKNILGVYNFSGVHKLAADTSGDGIINVLDLLQIQNNILCVSSIYE